MIAKEITLIIPTKLMAIITCSPRLSFLKGPIIYRDMMAKVITEAVKNVKITTETDILIDIQHLSNPIVHPDVKFPQHYDNKKKAVSAGNRLLMYTEDY